MNNEYDSPKIDVIFFDDESILTESVVVGGSTLPGEERVDGSEIFG